MKNIAVILLLLISGYLCAQDVPLFSQYMTNSFIYNPAVAGHSSGSLTYSFRKSFSQIQNAPQINFLSVQTPMADNRFGFGANLYQEEVNFLKNTYASAAFAYHLQINRANVISFGVSGEYNSLRLSGQTNSTIEDPDYQKLANGDLNDVDFSFGILYHNRFVKFGLAANRLATTWIKDPEQYILSDYYSGFVQGSIPLRGGKDVLAPYVSYRTFSELDNNLDIGLYYTYNDLLVAGLAFRNGPVASASVGFRVAKRFLIGYTNEVYLGDTRSQIGSTNEITLRLDFKKYSYKVDYHADYKNSVAYRRKTSATHSGSKTPAAFHAKQKKFTKHSPNKRYFKNSVNPRRNYPGKSRHPYKRRR
jgi:type IX secretion system PorP/SprF family membrane protein